MFVNFYYKDTNLFYFKTILEMIYTYRQFYFIYFQAKQREEVYLC